MKRQFCQVFQFLLGTLNLENDSNMFFKKPDTNNTTSHSYRPEPLRQFFIYATLCKMFSNNCTWRIVTEIMG